MSPENFDELVWTCGGGEQLITAVLDDALNHHPSLIVRGSEFTYAGRGHGTGPNGHKALLATERTAYAMLGRERSVVTVPMVLIGDAKMSKSEARVVHWSTLKAVPREVARAFLVATALRPDGPLWAMDEGFRADAISPEPYVWDWETWAEVVRRA